MWECLQLRIYISFFPQGSGSDSDMRDEFVLGMSKKSSPSPLVCRRLAPWLVVLVVLVFVVFVVLVVRVLLVVSSGP